MRWTGPGSWKVAVVFAVMASSKNWTQQTGKTCGPIAFSGLQSFVDLAEGQIDFDLGKRDEGIGAEVILADESPRLCPSIKRGGGFSRFNEEKNLQRGDGEIRLALLAEIGAPGRLTQDLDNDDRTVLPLFLIPVSVADDHGIGIVEARVIGQLDADLGVAVEGAAGLAPETGSEGDGDVGGDLIVPVSSTSHRMDLATKVLVFALGKQLTREILLHRDCFGLEQGGHVGNLPESDS